MARFYSLTATGLSVQLWSTTGKVKEIDGKERWVGQSGYAARFKPDDSGRGFYETEDPRKLTALRRIIKMGMAEFMEYVPPFIQCSALTAKGSVCKHEAMEGTGYCEKHQPVSDEEPEDVGNGKPEKAEKPRCKGVKKSDGTPCRAYPIDGEEYCRRHMPAEVTVTPAVVPVEEEVQV